MDTFWYVEVYIYVDVYLYVDVEKGNVEKGD